MPVILCNLTELVQSVLTSTLHCFIERLVHELCFAKVFCWCYVSGLLGRLWVRNRQDGFLCLRAHSLPMTSKISLYLSGLALYLSSHALKSYCNLRFFVYQVQIYGQIADHNVRASLFSLTCQQMTKPDGRRDIPAQNTFIVHASFLPNQTSPYCEKNLVAAVVRTLQRRQEELIYGTYQWIISRPSANSTFYKDHSQWIVERTDTIFCMNCSTQWDSN